jgi:hypothetical protein
MAILRTWRGTAAAASSLQYLQYKVETGQHVVVPVGGATDQGTILPAGLQVIFDFGQHWEGEVAYKPKFDDSRMRLKGTELAPYSGDPNYSGGEKIHVMVQRYGLCSLLSTAETVVRVLNLLYDKFIFAPEAANGQLPIFRISEPRGFYPKQRAGMLYAPVYSSAIVWVNRDPNAFGPRPVPPPKPMLEADTKLTTARELAINAIFESATAHGEVIPPEHQQVPVKKAKPHPKKKGQQPDDELDDVVPF